MWMVRIIYRQHLPVRLVLFLELVDLWWWWWWSCPSLKRMINIIIFNTYHSSFSYNKMEFYPVIKFLYLSGMNGFEGVEEAIFPWVRWRRRCEERLLGVGIVASLKYKVAIYTWPCVSDTLHKVTSPVYKCTVAYTGPSQFLQGTRKTRPCLSGQVVEKI